MFSDMVDVGESLSFVCILNKLTNDMIHFVIRGVIGLEEISNCVPTIHMFWMLRIKPSYGCNVEDSPRLRNGFQYPLLLTWFNFNLSMDK